MKKLKIGFVGCGSMGQLAHIANYAILPDVELVALADLRQETAREVAKRYRIHNVYNNHKELLEKADIDAVVAIMHFGLHYSVIPDILKKGKHCLTEKPIAVKASTAKSLNKIAIKNKLIYQIGCMKRCDPASRIMKEKIQEWKTNNKYGHLKYLRVSMPPGNWTFQIESPLNMNDRVDSLNFRYEETPDWMDQETRKKYISFVNYYIHQVNMIRYILGENYKVTYADPTGILMIARSDSGITIALEMNTYRVRDEWHEFYTACFEKGKISLSLPAPMARQHSGKLEYYKNGKNGAIYEAPVIPPKWSMLEQARLFVEAVQGKTPCISPTGDAIKDLEIAEDFIRLLCE